jgi:hypothetical protein
MYSSRSDLSGFIVSSGVVVFVKSFDVLAKEILQGMLDKSPCEHMHAYLPQSELTFVVFGASLHHTSPKLLNLYLTIYTPIMAVTHCKDCDEYLQLGVRYMTIQGIDFCDIVGETFQRCDIVRGMF